MKIRFLILILIFSVDAFSQDYKQLHKGVEYAEMTRQIDGVPVKMNLLRLDLRKVRLDVVHANDRSIGLEKTSSIAQRKGALAAVNAGYFRIDKSKWEGDAAGLLQIDGKLLSESTNNRAALFITNSRKSTETHIGRLRMTLSMRTKGLKAPRLSFFLTFDAIDRERKDGELALFTPLFGPTTLTGDEGIEIVLNGKGKIMQILDGKGNTPIPAGGWVISASGARRNQFRDNLKVGDTIMLDRFTSSVDVFPVPAKMIQQAEDIVAGQPMIARNGAVAVTWREENVGESHVTTKHPRTAAAKLRDGKFLLITLDGRSESSGGIAQNDLAKMMLELGATDAINLDGGGSTTMYLDGKIVNQPSDKTGERSVSDAIIVTARKR